MKLSRLDKLLATLATQINDSQLEQMLSKSTDLHEWDKTEIANPIQLLVKLRWKCSRDGEAAFLESLTQLLEGVEDGQRLVDAVCEHQRNASNESEGASQQFPNGAFLFRPKQHQKKYFRDKLMEISRCLSRRDFEIMKALSPVPESSKDKANVGFKLFGDLQHYGKISENDVEYLDDFFTHLDLIRPLEILREYQRRYPAQHCETPPTAPSQHLPSPHHPHSPSTHTPHHPRPTYQGATSYLPLSQHSTLPGMGMGESHTLSSHHVTTPVQEHSSRLYSRPPDQRDPMYPRLNTAPPHPTSDTPSPHHTSHPPHPTSDTPSPHHTSHPPHLPHTAHPPPAHVSAVRGAGDHISVSNPFQMESTPPTNRPPPQNPMFAPVHPFQKQSSLATDPVLHSPATGLSTQSPIISSHNTNCSNANTPSSSPATSLSTHTPVTPSQNTSRFNPSSHSPHPISGHSSLPASISLSSVAPATHEPVSASASIFPDAQTVQSLRGRCPNLSSHSPGHSLPTAQVGEDRLLAGHSRPVDELARVESAGHRNRGGGVPHHHHHQRNVFTRGDVGASVGRTGAGELSSINVSVSHQAENIENNRSRPPSASASNPSASDDSHHCLSVTPLSEQPHLPPPSLPVDPSQRSSFVSGVSSFSTRATSSGNTSSGSSYSGTGVSSYGSSYGSEALIPHNPHNTLASQIVSPNATYDSTLFSSPLPPHFSQRASLSSHEPSTGSLVKRQRLLQHGPSGERLGGSGSNSFAPIPEERGQEGGNGYHDESHESEPSSVATSRKRSRGEETAENSTASSSSGAREGEGGEGRGDVKRVRTEEQRKTGGTEGFWRKTVRSLPIIGRLLQPKRESKRDSDSDSDAFEDANENNSPIAT